MEELTLPEEMSVHFSDACRDALVEALRITYQHASAPWDDSIGYDMQLFRFMLYKLGMHQLKLLCDRGVGLFIHSPAPLFRLGVGPFQLASYACGYRGDDDIWTSFPNNDQGAPNLSDINQLTLFGENAEPSGDARPAAIVLAHFGNPEIGLEAVYLAVPAAKENDRISRWSHAELLWKTPLRVHAKPEGETLRPVDVPTPDLEFINPLDQPSNAPRHG